jgi:two-component system, chemotaxis family, sensor kinase CheA
MNVQDEIRAGFIGEVADHLTAIEGQLLSAERTGASDEAVRVMFRSLHSIKGASGFLNLDVMGDLAHTMEDLVDLVRSQGAPFNRAVIDLLLQGVDALRAMIKTEDLGENAEIDELLDGLEDQIETSSSPVPPTGTPIARHTGPPTPNAPNRAPTPLMPGRAEHSPEQTVRVRNALLDRALSQVQEALSQRASPGQLQGKLTALHHTILECRLLDLKEVFLPFPRLVRDLARLLGKEVRLTISGSGIAIDRNQGPVVTEALTHLIRNAIDHGVEHPHTRTNANKDPRARLDIVARQTARGVRIIVADDGGGFDARALRRASVRTGQLSQAAAHALSDEDALELAFLAGLSTAEQVTQTSGRGVGLDAVRATLAQVGGSIRADSTPGVGTRMTMLLPSQLSLLRCLVVTILDRKVAVPVDRVQRLVHLPSEPRRYQMVDHAGERLLFGPEGGRPVLGDLHDAPFALLLDGPKGPTVLLTDQVHSVQEVLVRAVEEDSDQWFAPGTLFDGSEADVWAARGADAASFSAELFLVYANGTQGTAVSLPKGWRLCRLPTPPVDGNELKVFGRACIWSATPPLPGALAGAADGSLVLVPPSGQLALLIAEPSRLVAMPADAIGPPPSNDPAAEGTLELHGATFTVRHPSTLRKV